MLAASSIHLWRFALPRAAAWLALASLHTVSCFPQEPAAVPLAAAVKQSREAGPPDRIPRQMALTTAALDGTVRERVSDTATRPVVGARIELREMRTGKTAQLLSSGDGVFRVLLLTPGVYEAQVSADGYAPLQISSLALNSNEVLTLEIFLVAVGSVEARSRLPRQPELGPPLTAETVGASMGSYREFRHRLDADPNYIAELSPDVLPPASDVFEQTANRWQLPQPNYRRYSTQRETPYQEPHWYDPFNRNRFKGDEPIWPSVLGQQVFLNFTGSAQTVMDGRQVPTPSGGSTEQPGSYGFFGRGKQFALDQTFRFSFDLFHGDASFKPVDWRIRITPEFSLNYLDVQELGVVSPDVRKGTTRFDSHVGLQEAFVEVKLHDLSPNYDFVSARAGIQGFNADFRGFLFDDEQLGLRVFGNLKNDRFEYNAAYFNLLEKNTNSGLNTFDLRDQQVVIGNLYIQDVLIPGYTVEFVGAWNKDDPSIHFDDNGFLVRPAPIGNVVNQGVGPIPHGIRVGYFGWLGSGHIKKLNLTHAFYEAAGEDTFNPIAGRRTTVNAQMAAVELSLDRNWIRYRVSAFFASGDSNPRSGRANGFDAIDDLPNFAGGEFSFWNHEAIKLTGSGVALTTDGSLLPNMRSSKQEGQANFVNPGIFLVNAGADFDITPKLRGFANYNFLRFMRTEPLEYAIFQSEIHHTIGSDLGVGVQYRPPLSENIVLTGGASMLQPGQGFRDIYTGRTQFPFLARQNSRFEGAANVRVRKSNGCARPR